MLVTKRRKLHVPTGYWEELKVYHTPLDVAIYIVFKYICSPVAILRE